jgi:hypothetical protein
MQSAGGSTDTADGSLRLKRKLFTSRSLGNIRANMRKGITKGSAEDSPGSSKGLSKPASPLQQAKREFELLPAPSLDLEDLIPAIRTASAPAFTGTLERQPLNVLYPSLSGLEVIRTLGAPPHTALQVARDNLGGARTHSRTSFRTEIASFKTIIIIMMP